MANNLYNYPSGMSSIPTYSYDPSLTGHSARYGRTASSSSAVQSEVGVNGGVGSGAGVHSLFSWGGAGMAASFTDAMLIEEIKRRNEGDFLNFYFIFNLQGKLALSLVIGFIL